MSWPLCQLKVRDLWHFTLWHTGTMKCLNSNEPPQSALWCNQDGGNNRSATVLQQAMLLDGGPNGTKYQLILKLYNRLGRLHTVRQHEQVK